MEFKRIETKRVVASQKSVKGDADSKFLFDILFKNKMKFAIVLGGHGELKDCSALEVGNDFVRIHSNYPSKVKKIAKFKDIMTVEVECNIDFIADDGDENGRWSRIN